MSDSDTRQEHVDRFLDSLKDALSEQGVTGTARVSLQDAAGYLAAVRDRDAIVSLRLARQAQKTIVNPESKGAHPKAGS